MQIQFDVPKTIENSKTASERSEFSREDFLKLLTAELTHQDPLNPLDQVEFLNQLTSLQTLEATSALTDGIGALQRFQGFSAASNLIGRTVVGVSDSGEVVRGRVDKVLYDPDTKEIKLEVTGRKVSLGNVREVLYEPVAEPDAVDEAISEADAEEGA
ncbi:MAG: hypothetical protein HY720_05325 [Planctomycetes bacterium]|nr:hypothetical protein [Planctomycetota bacterium]